MMDHFLRILYILLSLLFCNCCLSFQPAHVLIKSLVEDEECFTSEMGAQTFIEACATNILFEDCYEPQPFVGRQAVLNLIQNKIAMRQGKGRVRCDFISDGTSACGFAWTWVCGDVEGLRGTTYVELNQNGQIVYVREIPEPIFKPGDLTVELLKTITQGAEPNPKVSFQEKQPKEASAIVKYLFNEVQGQDVELAMKFFSNDVVYRDFNYENILCGKDEVKKFIQDFSFPGIRFNAQRFDDGIFSSCFTWEVVLMDAPDTIKGISFYQLDKESRLISYVRDVPESAIKPPILGKLARIMRPGLGVFIGSKVGSRDPR
jgi:hypothetical protein